MCSRELKKKFYFWNKCRQLFVAPFLRQRTLSGTNTAISSFRSCYFCFSATLSTISCRLNFEHFLPLFALSQNSILYFKMYFFSLTTDFRYSAYFKFICLVLSQGNRSPFRQTKLQSVYYSGEIQIGPQDLPSFILLVGIIVRIFEFLCCAGIGWTACLLIYFEATFRKLTGC